MKIIGIDQANSSLDWVAFRLDTPLTDVAASRFRQLYAELPRPSRAKMELRRDLICVAIVEIPQGFANILAGLLTQIEREEAAGRERAVSETELEAGHKAETLKRIAEEANLLLV